MCDDWDELREALRLLDDNRNTYELRSPEGVDYTLTCLNEGKVDPDYAHLYVQGMLKGVFHRFKLSYPLDWRDMNDKIHQAYISSDSRFLNS